MERKLNVLKIAKHRKTFVMYKVLWVSVNTTGIMCPSSTPFVPPLHELTKKNDKFVWSEKGEEAFQKLKQK